MTPTSALVEQIRQGEEILALIEPAARGRDASEFNAWLQARLTIGELQRLILPACDARCESHAHARDRFVALADLAIDETDARAASWWESWNGSLESELRERRVWYAGAPALPATDAEHRLRAGTRLTRLAVTDPYWVHYDHRSQETLYRIRGGRHRGELVVAVTFGHSPLLPGLAGALIAPDHPPVHDPQIAIRLLAAGWAAVERGLPLER